jgi:effector-binding domain-containing protein
MTVVYIERRGPYEGIGLDLQEISDWLAAEKVQAAGKPFCMYYDNPGETPRSELKSEACMPVSGRVRTVGRMKVKELLAADVAETAHKGKPEDFAMTYGPFLEWLITHGYKLDGPAREYYDAITAKMGPGSGVLIQQPVRRPMMAAMA